MKFLYIVLAISLVGCVSSQPLEDSELEHEEEFLYDEEGFEDTTEFIPTPEILENVLVDDNITEAVDPLDHRFGGGQPASVQSSCGIAIFVVERFTVQKNKFGKTQNRAVLRKGSLINGILTMDGHYIFCPLDQVRNMQNALVVKDTNSIVRVIQIVSIPGYNIALLKLCRRVTRIRACNIQQSQVCPASACSTLPANIIFTAYNGGGAVNKRPDSSITQGQGRIVPCPSNIPSTSCCFTSNQIPCQGDKGAGVYAPGGAQVCGIMDGTYSCQSQPIYSFTPIAGQPTQQIFYGVSRTLGCPNCRTASKIPTYVAI